jgi:hypothetical protein
VLYHYPFSGVVLVALFILMRQIFLASLLSIWQGRYLFWKVFLNPKVSKVKHADNLLWSDRMVLFIDDIVMPVPFLMTRFVNDKCMSF